MSQEPRLARSWVWLSIALYLLLQAGVIVGLIVFLFAGPGRPPDDKDKDKRVEKQGEQHLAQVRNTLRTRTADLTTCRGVVQALNAHQQQSKDTSVPSLSKGEAEQLKKELALTDDDVEEMVRPTFTPLDAHHLEACFLFRDAAVSLELRPMAVEGKLVRQEPLERARAGFDWAVRQVRLHMASAILREPAPPAAALRRGYGSPLERALVFLALLEQFGLEEDNATALQGCLIHCPDEKGNKRFWACGVAVGSKPDALYLFDPRLGLALPGPRGKGVATLAQAQKEPTVLGQLQIDKLRYDVTPEQARQAEVHVVCPLSAIARRMHFLQDHLLRDRAVKDRQLPPPVHVRLAEDPAQAIGLIREAVAGGGGKPQSVIQSQGGAALLRRFLTKEEGGSDTGVRFEARAIPGFAAPDDPFVAQLPRQELFRLEVVPWRDFPQRVPMFRDGDRNIIVDRPLPVDPMGLAIRSRFAGAFIGPLTDPRNLLLRGKYGPAVQALVPLHEKWMHLGRRYREAKGLEKSLDKGVAEWMQEAQGVYAALEQAKRNPDGGLAARQEAHLWQFRLGHPMDIYFHGHVAAALTPELAFQLALARHEEAVRSQNRVALATRAGLNPAGDRAKAQKTWTDAESYWKEFIEVHQDRLGAAEARWWRGEALRAQGKPEEAKQSLEDLSAPMLELEKLAALWRAKQTGIPGN